MRLITISSSPVLLRNTMQRYLLSATVGAREFCRIWPEYRLAERFRFGFLSYLGFEFTRQAVDRAWIGFAALVLKDRFWHQDMQTVYCLEIHPDLISARCCRQRQWTGWTLASNCISQGIYSLPDCSTTSIQEWKSCRYTPWTAA